MKDIKCVGANNALDLKFLFVVALRRWELWKMAHGWSLGNPHYFIIDGKQIRVHETKTQIVLRKI